MLLCYKGENMTINLERIKQEINHGNLTKLSRATGIPLRTLQDWKAQKSDWLHKSIERLTKIDSYLNEVENHDNKKIN